MIYMLHTQVHVSPLSPLLSVYQSVLASSSNFLLELMYAVYNFQFVLDEFTIFFCLVTYIALIGMDTLFVCVGLV